MVFRKPYAFFIKYFRIINLILVLFMAYFGYKLNLLHKAINGIYMGSLTNYSGMESSYLGFLMYLILIIISLIIVAMLLTLKRKGKPYRDYLFNLIYNVFLIVYFLSISNLFLTLNETLIEQTSLKLYSDISLLIIVPLIYFIVKYLLIVIGFDLKKFNFHDDILEMKQTEDDNEEVEVIFDKNTYKVKRGIRRYFREFKYYVLENKIILSIISGILILICFAFVFSINIFDSNKVKKNVTFNAGNFSFKVTNIYETEKDINYNNIKDDSKFVIINVNVKNNYIEGSSIDYKRIRIMFDNDYVYANNYFNKFFYDLGKPYNNEIIESGESDNFIFIFEVPSNYKSNNYIIKFYDRLTVKDDETIGSYKELKIIANKLDKNRKTTNLNLNENIVFNKKNYGDSNLTLNDYIIQNSYIYKKNDKSVVIRDKDINKILLILDYKLSIDTNSILYNYFDNDLNFFSEFVSIEYTYNNNVKIYNNVKVLDIYNGKVMLSVPYQIKESNNINLIINFRDKKIIYKLK